MKKRIATPTLLILAMFGLALATGCSSRGATVEDFGKPARVYKPTGPKEIAVIYEGSDSNAPYSNAVHLRFQEIQIEEEWLVRPLDYVTPIQTWKPGNIGHYVFFDGLVAPRLVWSTVLGIVKGPGEFDYFYLIPPVDLFGRFAYSGLRRRAGEDTSRLNKDFNEEYFQASRTMRNNYILNVVDWFGWFIPFYPVYASANPMTDEIREEAEPVEEKTNGPTQRKPLTTYLPIDQIAENYVILIDGKPIGDLLEGADGELREAGDGFVAVDLQSYLRSEKKKGDTFRIDIREKSGGDVVIFQDKEASVELASHVRDVAELNVFWRVPLDPLNPARVVPALRLIPADGGDRWREGQELEAILTVENIDVKESWKVRPEWLLPDNAEGCEVEVIERDEQVVEVLAPGEKAEFRMRLRARPDWVWQDEFAMSAEARYQARTQSFPQAEASIKASSNLPPELVLRGIDWEEELGLKDGRISPNERLFVRFNIENTGFGRARGAMVALEEQDPAFTAATSDKPEDAIPPGNVRNFAYTVKMPEDFEEVFVTSEVPLPFDVMLRDCNILYSEEIGELALPRQELINKPLDVVFEEMETP